MMSLADFVEGQRNLKDVKRETNRGETAVDF